MKCHYSVIRFVPDPFRGEFVNVGLIVGSAETGEWVVHRLSNTERVNRFRDGVPLAPVWAYLDMLDTVTDRAAAESAAGWDVELGPDWLAAESARLRNVVQTTRPAALLADDVDDAMRQLEAEFMVNPDRRARGRDPIVDAMRIAYRARLDRHVIHENGRVQVRNVRAPVSFVVGNGHLAQLTNIWSFRVQQPSNVVQQVKAWSWTLHQLRDEGGQVHVPGRSEPFTVDGDLSVDVVHDEPDSSEGRRALAEASDVLDGLRVTRRTAADVELTAQDAAEQLQTNRR